MISTEIATASKIMLGTTEAVAMYIGSTKMWPIGQLLHNYTNDYFTIESLLDNNVISLVKVKSCTISPLLYYSTNNGESWSSVSATLTTTNIATINTGNKLLIKSTNTGFATAWDTYNKFNGSKQFKVYGNVMSLLYGDSFINNSEFDSGSSHNLCGLFYGTTTIIDASNLILPATVICPSSYNGMFRGCTGLEHCPKILPGETLEQDAYSSMFEGCINLEEGPEEIHAKTFTGTGAMQRMFCMDRNSRITTPKLTRSPILTATTLSNTCYKEMFKGNGNLVEVICLAESGLGNCANWLVNCSSTGTFYKAPNITWSHTGTSNVPTGWTIVDYTLS